MKYRITSIDPAPRKRVRGRLCARRRKSLLPCLYVSLLPACIPLQYTPERIRLELLFELGALPEPKKKSAAKKIVARSVKAIRAVFAGICNVSKKLLLAVLNKKGQTRPPFLAGALCAAIFVSLLSAAAVLIGLFGAYLAPYDALIVPSLEGRSYTEAESEIDPRFSVEVSYKSSESVAAGTVISQTPTAGVTRKLYNNGECVITLTVSSGRHYYTVEPLAGLDGRDALLILRNKGVPVKEKLEYSGEVDAGKVIATLPREGQRLYDGESLTLRISLGKEIFTVSVPDLYSLSEAQAESALTERGLKLGKITYQTSPLPAGKVISQQYAAYSALERGSTVDITVSLGKGYAQRTVPDLFGLTILQAQARLAQFGLVVGDVYTVSSGAPAGTVVAQTPIAGTPITSEITSIDIFISS